MHLLYRYYQPPHLLPHTYLLCRKGRAKGETHPVRQRIYCYTYLTQAHPQNELDFSSANYLYATKEAAPRERWGAGYLFPPNLLPEGMNRGQSPR